MVGSFKKFVACRINASVDSMSTGGGLREDVKWDSQKEHANIRPSPIDSYDTARCETVRANPVHVCNIPPYFLDTCENSNRKVRYEEDLEKPHPRV